MEKPASHRGVNAATCLPTTHAPGSRLSQGRRRGWRECTNRCERNKEMIHINKNITTINKNFKAKWRYSSGKLLKMGFEHSPACSECTSTMAQATTAPGSDQGKGRVSCVALTAMAPTQQVCRMAAGKSLWHHSGTEETGRITGRQTRPFSSSHTIHLAVTPFHLTSQLY